MKYSFYIVLCFCIGCAESNQTESVEYENDQPVSNENTAAETTQNQEIEFLSVLTDLNVRNTPGKEGVIIDKLAYGQRAIFLNEETDYKEKIIMRNQPRFDSWKKIRFSGSNGRGATDGWVFGGGMIRKEEAYDPLDSIHFKRNLSQITGEELTVLLGFEVLTLGYSNGFIGYEKLPKSQVFKKDGVFMIDHPETAKSFGFSLNGEFNQGNPVNSIVKQVSAKGRSYVCELVYENGNCVRASISGVYEGHEINFTTEKPAECTFSFLESTLQK